MMIRASLFALALAATAGVLAPTPTVGADPGGYSALDNNYYYLLTTGSNPIIVTNFPLLITQGQNACHSMAVGGGALDAIHALMVEGPYSFETANRIVTTAGNVYCPSH